MLDLSQYEVEGDEARAAAIAELQGLFKTEEEWLKAVGTAAAGYIDRWVEEDKILQQDYEDLFK